MKPQALAPRRRDSHAAAPDPASAAPTQSPESPLEIVRRAVRGGVLGVLGGVLRAVFSRGAFVVLVCLAIAPYAQPAMAALTFALSLWVGARAQRDRAAYDRKFFRPTDEEDSPLLVIVISSIFLLLRSALCAFIAFIVFASEIDHLLAARSIAFLLTTLAAVLAIALLDAYTHYDGVRVSYFRGPLLYGAIFYSLTWGWRYRPGEPPDAVPPSGGGVIGWMQRAFFEAKTWVINNVIGEDLMNHIRGAFEAITTTLKTLGGFLKEQDVIQLLLTYARTGDNFREVNAQMRGVVTELLRPIADPIAREFGVTVDYIEYVAFLASFNIVFGYVIAVYVAFWFGRASRAAPTTPAATPPAGAARSRARKIR